MSLINREALYEKACDLEAQALSYVGKIVNDESKIEEWKIWSAILAERTAFKQDVFDAPTIPQPERKKGMWIEHNPHKWGLGIVFECSECGEKIDCEPSNFCPNCGADMREDGKKA